jgi:putative ABC transport system permease protein
MMAGILIGVATATTTLVIAESQQIQIDRRFDLQRSGHVVVTVDRYEAAFFALERMERLERLAEVGNAGQLSIWQSSTAVRASEFDAPVDSPLIVASAAGLRAGGVDLVHGLSFDGLDRLQDQRLVWLGTDLASRLGIARSEQQAVFIDGLPFTVAGVISATPGFGYLNTSAVTSGPSAARFGFGETIRVIADVRPGSAEAVYGFAEVALDPEGRFELQNATPPDGEILQGNVAGDLRRIGLALGGFAALMGIVSVANTLMLTVAQRSREVGLRSALGWSRVEIAGLIMLEAALVGLLASLFGVALGLSLAGGWAWRQGWEPVIPDGLPVVVVLFGMVASVVGGIWPAWRAGSISPLTAMRG